MTPPLPQGECGLPSPPGDHDPHVAAGYDRARGCAESWVGTEPDNAAANALYAGLGGDPVESFHLYHYDL